MGITKLPEDCLAQVLSRTSLRDVLRSSVVSKHFLSVSDSDTVWDHFLPIDWHDILSKLCSSLPQFNSKKQLFLYLCHNPIFMHNNTHMFALEKFTGKKCYTLGARALKIAWGNGDTPEYWSFESISESRFPEVAKLHYVWWLEIKGRIHAKQLSPYTTYGVFLVYKMLSSNHTGFERTPVKVTVLEVDEDDEGPPRNNNHTMTVNNFYLQPTNKSAHMKRIKNARGELPTERGDGWMEIEMGRYYVSDIDRVSEKTVVEMTVWEVEAGTVKNGLVVQCIDLRPLVLPVRYRLVKNEDLN